MAIILPYFAEFSSFCGQLGLRKSSWLATDRFYPEKCHKVPTKDDDNGRAVPFGLLQLHHY